MCKRDLRNSNEQYNTTNYGLTLQKLKSSWQFFLSYNLIIFAFLLIFDFMELRVLEVTLSLGSWLPARAVHYKKVTKSVLRTLNLACDLL